MPIKKIYIIYIRMKNKEITRIQERCLYMTSTSYGHHVRVCTEKSQTSLRLEKAVFE